MIFFFKEIFFWKEIFFSIFAWVAEKTGVEKTGEGERGEGEQKWLLMTPFLFFFCSLSRYASD